MLAISGLNMVLAAGTFLIGARTLLSLVPGLAHRFAIKKLAAGGALIMVFAYILISGGAVSAVRSWIMISIMLIAVFFDRPSISLRNVGPVGIDHPGRHTLRHHGAGFPDVLCRDRGAGCGLCLVARAAGPRKSSSNPCRKPLDRSLEGAGGFFAGLLLSSLIGGLSTMIYSAGHFHRLAAYGLIGNLLAMPIISIFVMPFGLLAMLLMPLGLDRYPLLVMGQGLDWMISIAQMVASWGGEVTTGRIPQQAFLLIAAGGALACLFRTWLAISGLTIVAAGLVVISLSGMEQPDIVIAEDGRLVAMIRQAQASSNRTKPPDFVFSQWQRALRLEDHREPQQRPELAIVDAAEAAGSEEPTETRATKPPIDMDAARNVIRTLLSNAAPGRFLCVAKQWCAATAAQGWRIVTVDDARFIGVACDEADIVVTPAMLRFHTCRSGALLFSGQSLRRTGAVEIFGTGARTADKADGRPAMRMVFAASAIATSLGAAQDV